MRIYTVLTERQNTPLGRTHDRFNVAANTFEEACEKAKTSQTLMDGERIQAIHLIAQADE